MASLLNALVLVAYDAGCERLYLAQVRWPYFCRKLWQVAFSLLATVL